MSLVRITKMCTDFPMTKLSQHPISFQIKVPPGAKRLLATVLSPVVVGGGDGVGRLCWGLHPWTQTLCWVPPAGSCYFSDS